MAKSNRVTLTKKEAASDYGQKLINQIMSISDDGALSIEEVRVLHELLKIGPSEINAVPFLRSLTTTIISDGQLDKTEANELRQAMTRVVPIEVRGDLKILLSNIGLPFLDEDKNSDHSHESWEDDPITESQLDYIRDLGGVANDQMTKGQGSKLIEELKLRRPPTLRQMMVLRFFNRLDLANHTKQEVSLWLDNLYYQHEEYERAWDRFKLDNGDDGSLKDPDLVPIGEYLKYVKPPTQVSRRSIPRKSGSGCLGMIVLVVLGIVISAILWLPPLS